MRNQNRCVLVALLVTNLAFGHEFKIKAFEFIHPWTHAPARGVKDVPVYMVLRNTASTPDRIVAVSSGEFRAGKSEGERSVSTIQVLANATIELNADQPHILLLGLTEPLDGYQYFLTFERAGQNLHRLGVVRMRHGKPTAPEGHERLRAQRHARVSQQELITRRLRKDLL